MDEKRIAEVFGLYGCTVLERDGAKTTYVCLVPGRKEFTITTIDNKVKRIQIFPSLTKPQRDYLEDFVQTEYPEKVSIKDTTNIISKGEGMPIDEAGDIIKIILEMI